MQVYFCDPRSPCASRPPQRGTDENTNGRLRQYPPRAADVGACTRGDLDDIAAELNGRPREPLGWRSATARLLEPTEAG